MRALDETSGPWVGWSVQYNRKIHERILLRVRAGKIAGTGEDADGDFELDGDYDAAGEVAIVRRYTYCTGGPEGAGIPYLYRGRWDGALVSGAWKPVVSPYDGGPFEMWPEEPLTDLSFGEERQTELAGR